MAGKDTFSIYEKSGKFKSLVQSLKKFCFWKELDSMESLKLKGNMKIDEGMKIHANLKLFRKKLRAFFVLFLDLMWIFAVSAAGNFFFIDL